MRQRRAFRWDDQEHSEDVPSRPLRPQLGMRDLARSLLPKAAVRRAFAACGHSKQAWIWTYLGPDIWYG